MAKADLKRRWEPSEPAFQQLLSWLDDGTDSGGETYLSIRERLVHYFARRNGPFPEDLADETLNRVARRLEEAGSIDDVTPAQFCYITAKFVLLEALRQQGRQAAVEPGDGRIEPADDAAEEGDRTFACLERCLAACSPSDRELILEYYRTESGSARAHRKQLAVRLGLTANSLAIRACRIRSRLERCVRACRENMTDHGRFVSYK
jgi:DNA-directed RNA polymerase specialized sigma24 family protein